MFGVRGQDFRINLWNGVQGSRFRFQGSGFMVLCSGCGVWGVGCGMQGNACDVALEAR